MRCTEVVVRTSALGEDHGARREATATFVDRDLNVVALNDGTELHVTDRRMLESIYEGMRVVVHHGGRRHSFVTSEPRHGR